MRTFEISIPVKAYTEQELPQEWRELVEKAKQATENTYSPYSHFGVGAALLLDDGTILTGANQENAAYPSGLCAERTVMFYAHANHKDKAFKAIAIAGFTGGHFVDEPISPCAGCRQVMIEFEHATKQDMVVILYGAKETYIFPNARCLVPYCFVEDNLKG